jgi:hypothetical protein
MQRLGWTPTGPLSFKDAQGTSHAFLTLGPRLVSALARRDWMHSLRSKASESLGMTGADKLDLYHARKLLLGGFPFSPLERGSLVNFLVQGIWTKHRLEASGYLVGDTDCVLCRGAVDTVAHRVFECPASEAARSDLLSADELHKLINEPSCKWARMGLATDPALACPRPATEGDEFWHREGDTIQSIFAGGGDLYLDGSCTQEWHPSLNRAAWAIVRLDHSGVLLGRVSGPVWSTLPQTSPCAEFVAYAAAAQHARPQTNLHVDYQGVVAAHHSATRLSYHKTFAGVTRSATTCENWPNVANVLKVKAHQDLSTLDIWSDQWLHAKGNHLADAAAKQALEQHPPIGDTDGLRALSDLAVKVCKLAARVLPLWPTESGRFQKVATLRPEAPRGSQAEAPATPSALAPSHSFVWRRGVYRCERCLLKATTEQGMLQRRDAKCPGQSAAIARTISGDWGHSLFGFEVIPTGEPLLGCVLCGAFCTSMPRSLAKPCPGQPAHTESKFAVTAMAEGRHPQRVKAKQGLLLSPGVLIDRQLYANDMDQQ